MNIKSTVVCTVLLVCAANILQAQEQHIPLPNDPAIFLEHKLIHDELKLSDAQKIEAIKVCQKANTERQALQQLKLAPKETAESANELAEQHRKELEQFLKPQQIQRLTEASLQYLMYLDPCGTLADRVGDKLSLSVEQKTKLLELKTEQHKELFQPGVLSGSKSGRGRLTLKELRNKQKGESVSVLTSEQKQRLADLLGKDFDASEMTTKK
jgi:hypothetical protein